MKIKYTTMETCKYQVIKKDKDGLLIYKCKLNTEPNENVFRIKKHFEELFPGKTFCINSGVCYYIGYENECTCCK